MSSCGAWGGACQAQHMQDKHGLAEACPMPYMPHVIRGHHHLGCAPAGMLA